MKKVYLALLIIGLLLGLPRVVNRISVEHENRTYEMTVPYEQIQYLVNEGLSKEEMYEQLKEAGVKSLVVRPMSLENLEERGMLNVLEKQEFVEVFPDVLSQFNTEESGLYVQLLENMSDVEVEGIKEVLGVTEIVEKSNGELFLFVPGSSRKLLITQEGKQIKNQIYSMPIGFDENLISEVKDAGFETVFFVGNDIQVDDQTILNQMVKLNEKYSASRVIFYGKEVLGFPNEINDFAAFFKENNFEIIQIEFAVQSGDKKYGYLMSDQLIRLHSMDLFKEKLSDGQVVDRLVRAIKERNIRMVYMYIANQEELIQGIKEPTEMFNRSVSIIKKVNERLSGQFEVGKAQPYEWMPKSMLPALGTVLGGSALSGLAVMSVLPLLSVVVFVGMLILGAAFVFLKISIAGKLFALGVAIIGSAYGVIAAQRYQKEKGNILVPYMLAVLIALATSYLVITHLYGTDYLVKVSEFSGVKLLFISPILLVLIYMLYKQIPALLMKNIKVYQVVIAGVIGIIGLYYISRSGNDATVSELELSIRQGLENLFYVRPRTKEFLIGYPMLLLALYLQSQKKSYSIYVFVIGVIGVMSSVNTFTHLHIPILISFLRTIYGVILGAIIGYGYIYIYKLVEKHVLPKVKWKR